MLTKIELDNGTMYIGTAYEISRLYMQFKKRDVAYPAFCDDPVFNFKKYYGLVVDKIDLDGREIEDWSMHIVAGDTALAMIYDL